MPADLYGLALIGALGKSFGDSIYTLAAIINLGQLQEADSQLFLAAETYRRVLHLADDPPQRMACEAHLGLARICMLRVE